jgi:hypothetical protein
MSAVARTRFITKRSMTASNPLRRLLTENQVLSEVFLDEKVKTHYEQRAARLTAKCRIAGRGHHSAEDCISSWESHGASTGQSGGPFQTSAGCACRTKRDDSCAGLRLRSGVSLHLRPGNAWMNPL